MTTGSVDTYLAIGCGRCSLGGTPQCKVYKWQAELVALRGIALNAGLTEEVKWGQPTYTVDGKNVLIVTCFNDFASVNFFKGSLINDPQKLLVKSGPNSEASRLLKYTNLDQIIAQEDLIKNYMLQAVEIEQAGLKVASKPVSELELPEELTQILEQDPVFNKAFFSLSPSKQKGYIFHIAGAKQSATRASRIETCMPKILAGKGMMDR